MTAIKAKRSEKVTLLNVCREVAMIKRVMFQGEIDGDQFYKEFQDYKDKVKELEERIKTLEDLI